MFNPEKCKLLWNLLQNLLTVFDIVVSKHNFKAFILLVGIDMPRASRIRQLPKKLREGGPAHQPSNIKDEYRQQYIEVHDHIISAVKDRFDQKGYDFFMSIESLILHAANDNEGAPNLAVLSGYDIDISCLTAELAMLPALMANSKKPYTLKSVISVFQNMSEGVRTMYADTVKILKLLLLLPATNAVSERSFSHLRRIKNYLRNSMSQERLNHAMLIRI